MQLCTGILSTGADRSQACGQCLCQCTGIRHRSVLQRGVQGVNALLQLRQSGTQLFHLLEVLRRKAAAQTVRQSLQTSGHLCTAGLQLCSTAGQRSCTVLQLAAVAGQGLGTAVSGSHAVRIAVDTAGQRAGTVRQCHCTVCQCAGTACQLIHAVRQSLGTAVDSCHTVGVGLQTAFQGLCTVYKCQRTVRQKLQIVGNGGVAVLQIGNTVLDLQCTICRITHAVAYGSHLIEDRFGVLLGHTFGNFLLDLCQSRFAHLAGDVVGAGIGGILQFHFLRLIVHEGGSIFREI